MTRTPAGLPVCRWKLSGAADAEAHIAHDPMVRFGTAVSAFGLAIQLVGEHLSKHLFKDAEAASLVLRDVVALPPTTVQGIVLATFSGKLLPGLLHDSVEAAQAAFVEETMRLLAGVLCVHNAATEGDEAARSLAPDVPTAEMVAASVRGHLNRLAGVRLCLRHAQRQTLFDQALASRVRPRSDGAPGSGCTGAIEQLDRRFGTVRIFDGTRRQTLHLCESELYAAAVAQLLEVEVVATPCEADAFAHEVRHHSLRFVSRQLDLQDEFEAMENELRTRTSQPAGDRAGE
jgi:hypothetical protein